jgi:hypothetical protein
MQTDEAIMFKQMDTRSDQSKYCFHTAFDHPDTPATARGRRSVEFRVMLAIRKGKRADADGPSLDLPGFSML